MIDIDMLLCIQVIHSISSINTDLCHICVGVTQFKLPDPKVRRILRTCAAVCLGAPNIGRALCV
jgi:hypothetical protein